MGSRLVSVPKEESPAIYLRRQGFIVFLYFHKDYNTATFFTGSGFSGAKIRIKIGKFRENQRKIRENQRNSEKIREKRRKIEKFGEKSEKIGEKRRKTENYL